MERETPQDTSQEPLEAGDSVRFSIPLAWSVLLGLLFVLMLLRAAIAPRWSAGQEAGGWAASPAFVVDVNTASQAELQALPEIGSSLAERIVQYRQTHGRFESVEAMQAVRGLGPKTLEQLRPMLSVD